LQDNKHGEVAVMSPDTFLKSLNASP